MSKRILQIVIGAIGILALYTGVLGYVYGAVNWYYGFPANMDLNGGLLMLDSNLRFYSGLWFGLGLVLFWLIPRIERDTTVLTCLAAMFFMGGIGRIVSILACGLPSVPYVSFILLELGFPLLALWQRKLRRAS